MSTTKIESICPYCYTAHDRASNLSHEAPPIPGDFSFCWFCGEVGIWDPNLGLAKVEFEYIPPDMQRELMQIKRAWSRMQEVA